MLKNQEPHSVTTVDLSPLDYKKRITRLKIEFLAVVIGYNIFLLLYGKVNLITIACFLGFNIVATIVWLQFIMKLRGASITNNMMILKDTNDQVQVTPVRSVSLVRDKRIFMNSFSKVQYRLDGMKHKVFILSLPHLTLTTILKK